MAHHWKHVELSSLARHQHEWSLDTPVPVAGAPSADEAIPPSLTLSAVAPGVAALYQQHP
jgi:hypothetical protein